MNRYQFRGRAKEAVGKIEKIVGRAVGSHTTQAKGLAKEIAGKVEKTAGDVQSNLADKKK